MRVRPTPGPVEIRAEGDANFWTLLSPDRPSGWVMAIQHNGEFLVATQQANMNLIAEAFDVFTKTGMTPRQLANFGASVREDRNRLIREWDEMRVQRDELLAALQKMRSAEIGIYGIPEPILIEADDAIAKATGVS